MPRMPDPLRRLDHATRLNSPEMTAALSARWEELPAAVRTPAQLLGRRSTGCEGTHGVFPQCNLGCRPCYHSTDANLVRVDGPHTTANVDAQMAYARRTRGPGAYAQLIGGEVTLLDPEDHAAALRSMAAHQRVPMSFSHGDFDFDYLEALALDATGRPRFTHLAFAIHIDSTMRGRRAAPRPVSERELDGERARVAAMFDRLQRTYGVTSYLAHNMTVTPGNLDEVPGVIARNRHLGYRMFSFQPAAYVGHEDRWEPGYRGFDDDDVWARIEEGAGVRLPHRALVFGHPACNRVSWGAYVGDRYVPVLDDDDPRDLDARDHLFAAFPGPLGHGPLPGRALRIARAVAAHPTVVPAAVSWAKRFVGRAGGRRARWSRIRPTTFVMHRFIDAAQTAAAWSHLQDGTTAPSDLAETVERLRACAYSMPHPESDEMVPACVQHAVLDPQENAALVELLPRRRSRRHQVEGSRVPGA
ncbi:MAG: radical SAM domain-containing protein [Acidimicrobiales bacterium]